jgi:hypothetical protein
MQTTKLYPIPNEFIALLIDGTETTLTEYYQLYSRPIKLYYGSTNPLKVTFLTADQKAVNMTNINVCFNLFEVGSQEVLLSKTGNIANANSGVATITILPTDISNLELGYYEAAFSAVDSTGAVTAVYTDDHYGSRITVDLDAGPVNVLPPATQLNFTVYPVNGINANVSQQINLTSRNTGVTTFTMQGNLDTYTGNVIFQGTLSGQPTESDFSNIAVTNYSNVSGPIILSAAGTFAYIQVYLDGTTANANASCPIYNANLRY